jgi:hypothetical protein
LSRSDAGYSRKRRAQAGAVLDAQPAIAARDQASGFQLAQPAIHRFAADADQLGERALRDRRMFEIPTAAPQGELRATVRAEMVRQ